MKPNCNNKGTAKDRITTAAIELFSEKGFDGTTINEIAAEANVNKALIYYYFKNKEDVLDSILQTLFDGFVAMSLDFIREHVAGLVKDGRLNIKSDCFCFSNKDDMAVFIEATNAYFERIIDFVLLHKRGYRILLVESLKGKRNHTLLSYLDYFERNNDNPIFKIIKDVDEDFNYTNDMVVVKFFFGLVPVINFAAFFDDFITYKQMDEQELRKFFLRFMYALTSAYNISGNNIYFADYELL